MINQKIIRIQYYILLIYFIILIPFSSSLNIFIFSLLLFVFYCEYTIYYFYYRNHRLSFQYSILARKTRKRKVLGDHIIDTFANEVNIKTYYQSIWHESNNNFDDFVNNLIFITVLERICAERQIHGLKIKHCSKPFCKMWKYGVFMMNQNPNFKSIQKEME